jgi:hypothetical protein
MKSGSKSAKRHGVRALKRRFLIGWIARHSTAISKIVFNADEFPQNAD